MPTNYPSDLTAMGINKAIVQWNEKQEVVTAYILNYLVRLTREKAGRNPTYTIIDSQSIKTTSTSAERGFDGGKKTKGRKRHIVTDW